MITRTHFPTDFTDPTDLQLICSETLVRLGISVIDFSKKQSMWICSSHNEYETTMFSLCLLLQTTALESSRCGRITVEFQKRKGNSKHFHRLYKSFRSIILGMTLPQSLQSVMKAGRVDTDTSSNVVTSLQNWLACDPIEALEYLACCLKDDSSQKRDGSGPLCMSILDVLQLASDQILAVSGSAKIRGDPYHCIWLGVGVLQKMNFQPISPDILAILGELLALGRDVEGFSSVPMEMVQCSVRRLLKDCL